MSEPWAFIAVKNSRVYGVVAPDPELLKDFYKDFVGYEIKSIYSRAEWLDVSKDWGDPAPSTGEG